MHKVITVVLILACLMMLCEAQTFQYSRGWQNGKRASSQNLLTPSQLLQVLGNKSGERYGLSPCDLKIAAFLASHRVIAEGNDIRSEEDDALPRTFKEQ